MTDIPDNLAAELAALADGTLHPARSRLLAQRIEHSPELAAALAQQRRALTALTASTEVDAPQSLREALGSAAPSSAAATSSSGGGQRRASRGRRRARPRTIRIVVAGLGISVVLTLLGLLSGERRTGSERAGLDRPLLAAVALTQERTPASGRAPAPAGRGLLVTNMEGLHFPDWAQRFGWEARAKRVQRLDGHTTTAVYYTRGGQRLGYAILALPTLALHSSRSIAIDGVSYALTTVNGVPTVFWRLDGHTCLIAGRGLSEATLLALASWR